MSRQAITDKQYNYLKGLIKKTSDEFYYDLRVSEGIAVGTTEKQLSKKQAMRLIGHLKTRADKIKADQASKVFDVNLASVGFQIETSYNTTMEAETEEALLEWAEGRFKRDPLSLKQIQKFLADKERLTAAVPGYKIKRS